MNKQEEICHLRGSHAIAEGEVLIDGLLFRLVCPRCGFSKLVTFEDIAKDIIETLTKAQ